MRLSYLVAGPDSGANYRSRHSLKTATPGAWRAGRKYWLTSVERCQVSPGPSQAIGAGQNVLCLQSLFPSSSVRGTTFHETRHVILRAYPQLIFSVVRLTIASSQSLYRRPVDRSSGLQAGKCAVMGSSAQVLLLRRRRRVQRRAAPTSRVPCAATPAHTGIACATRHTAEY